MAKFSVQIRRMLNRGVVATFEKLLDKQANGWIGSTSIHPDPRARRRRRERNAATRAEREARLMARNAANPGTCNPLRLKDRVADYKA